MTSSWPGFSPSPTRTATSARRSRSWAWEAASRQVPDLFVHDRRLSQVENDGGRGYTALPAGATSKAEIVTYSHGCAPPRTSGSKAMLLMMAWTGRPGLRPSSVHRLPGHAGHDAVAAAIELHIHARPLGLVDRGNESRQHIQRAQALGLLQRQDDVAGAKAHAQSSCRQHARAAGRSRLPALA